MDGAEDEGIGVRVAIVEDEAIVAARLERLVSEILGDRLTTLRVLPGLNDARIHLESSPVDVLFLDLNLNGKDGFALLEEAVAGSFATIVVSAHHDQALRAFELGVTDFVPKPFARDRIARGLARVDAREPELRQRIRKLAIRRARGIDLVDVDRILYVRGAGDYSALHTEEATTPPMHHKSLSALEHLLPPRFVRIHRSYLVDLERVHALHSRGGGKHQVTLEDGTELPVARGRITELRERLSE